MTEQNVERSETTQTTETSVETPRLDDPAEDHRVDTDQPDVEKMTTETTESVETTGPDPERHPTTTPPTTHHDVERHPTTNPPGTHGGEHRHPTTNPPGTHGGHHDEDN